MGRKAASGFGRSGNGKTEMNTGSRNKAGDEFFYSHKKGHRKDKCRKRQRDLKGNGNQDHPGGKKGTADKTTYIGAGFSGAIISEREDNNDNSTVLYSANDHGGVQSILDLGATEHLVETGQFPATFGR